MSWQLAISHEMQCILLQHSSLYPSPHPSQYNHSVYMNVQSHDNHVLIFPAHWYRAGGTGWEYSSRQEIEASNAIIPTVASVQTSSMYEMQRVMQDYRCRHVTWNWDSPEDCEDCHNAEFNSKDTCIVQDVILLLCLELIIFKIHGRKGSTLWTFVPVFSLVCKSSLIKTQRSLFFLKVRCKCCNFLFTYLTFYILRNTDFSYLWHKISSSAIIPQ